jgi:hypothetical protein
MLSTSYLHESESTERNAEGQGQSRRGCVHSRDEVEEAMCIAGADLAEAGAEVTCSP